MLQHILFTCFAFNFLAMKTKIQYKLLKNQYNEVFHRFNKKH